MTEEQRMKVEMHRVRKMIAKQVEDMTNKGTITACDHLVHECAAKMLEEGASLGMTLDRLLTFSAAQACKVDGAFNAAAAFRHIADQIDNGIFAHLEPIDGKRGH